MNSRKLSFLPITKVRMPNQVFTPDFSVPEKPLPRSRTSIMNRSEPIYMIWIGL